MNAQQASGMPGRSPFEAVAQEVSTGIDSAYPTDELSHPEYVNDEFRMFTFKVMKCPKRYVHDWRSCPFAHPTENARRRDPREVRYMPVPCPDYKRGLCLMGDSCTYSHGVYECWLHPAKYRTQLCKDGGQCRRPVCFFAHSVSELRSPTYTWDNAEEMGTIGAGPAGMHQGGLAAPGLMPGGPDAPVDAAVMPYPTQAHSQVPYQQQEYHQAMDPHQAQMHPYPPGQPPSPYADPYYGPQTAFAHGPDPYMGMSMNPPANSPQFGNAGPQGFSSPFQAVGGQRMYPQQPPRGNGGLDVMGHPAHVSPYQREQQRLQTMHRFHSQQLSQQQQQQQAQRQQSGPAPAGSLAASSGGARAPSSELGDLLGVGAGPGTTAPRMSNAMARSLGLVPPKETRTRTLGALAGLIQGPRATSLTDGLSRPQISYSLPAQLPDPDQHMHEVYLAAQAAAAAAGNSQASSLQSGTQRQASVGLPPTVGSGALGLSQGLGSQTLRQASVGSAQRQASLGLPQGQGSLGLPQGQVSLGSVPKQGSLGLAPGQGSMGRAPSMPAGGTQRQGSLGLPPGMRHGSGTLQYEPTPQDLQGWQVSLQQGLDPTLQQGQGQGDAAQKAQERSVIEQMQKLGLFADGAKHLHPAQLQDLVSMLHKQGLPQTWNRSSTSLAGHTIPELPEVEQLAEAPSDKETLASLLSSFQSMGLIQEQPLQEAKAQHLAQTSGSQAAASPFASPEHASQLESFEGDDSKAIGGKLRPQGSHPRQLSVGTVSSASSTGAGGLANAASLGSKNPSPFASPSQQLHHISSNSSLGSGPGKSPSGRVSQPTMRQASSPAVSSAI